MQRIPAVASALCGLVSLLALPAFLAAQQSSIRGSVTSSETGEPIVAALVVLLADDDVTRGTALTDDAGRFLLHALPGAYRLRVQRIGYRDTDSPEFVLGLNAALVRDVVVPSEAIVLAPITADARRRCVVRPQDGLALATLWAEARKALQAMAHADRARLFRFNVRRHARELDRRSLQVLSDTSQIIQGMSDRSPFIGMPIEALLRTGFVVFSEEDGAHLYYAPDAEALLSDEFLDAHCFRLAEDEAGSPNEIGITFEPVSRSELPGVHGTFWIDRATFELRSMDYGYTPGNLRRELVDRARGRVVFEALPSGAWVVRRWRIRMPIVQQSSSPWTRWPRLTVRALVEEGGEVLEVLALDGQVLQSSSVASLNGVVRDSARAAPLAGAEVRLTGTSFTTVTDERGGFRFDGLAEGEFAVELTHPDLERYGVSLDPKPVTLAAGVESQVELGVPAEARVRGLGLECPFERPFQPGRGILRGVVIDELTGVALSGATVQISWPADTGGASAQLRTARNGSYIACGVPTDRPLTVLAAAAGRESEPLALDELGPIAIGERDLSVPVQADVVALEGIEVIARTALEEARRRSGTRFDVLSRADFESMHSTTGVIDLVRRFPSITVRETFEGASRIASGLCIESRRSTSDGCNQTLIVIDGMARFETGILMSMDIEAIESIEHIPSIVARPLFGAQGENGVIVIHTRGSGPYRRR